MIANLIALNAILLEHVNASTVGGSKYRVIFLLFMQNKIPFILILSWNLINRCIGIFWNCATWKVVYAEWQQLEDEKGGCIQIHDVYTGQSI